MTRRVSVRTLIGDLRPRLRFWWMYTRPRFLRTLVYLVTYPGRWLHRRTSDANVDWYVEHLKVRSLEKQVRRLRAALGSEDTDDVDLKLDVQRLREQVTNLRREVTHQRECLTVKNRQLDALHHVWCNGGCEGGVHRYDSQGASAITEEVVRDAVHSVNRLVTWFNNHEFKHLDGLDETGVKNRFLYIGVVRAYEEAVEIAGSQGHAAAWDHLVSAVTGYLEK